MNPPPERLLRVAAAALVTLCVGRLVVWLPGYLTRPLFADHDVFATMALGWEVGLKPYRDLVSNNFPGTIYLFWGLGRAFGWGNVPAFYAADVALVVAFGAVLLAWSRARFGRILPGAIGLLAFTSSYLDLDFTQTAQRDGHAGLLVVMGLLAAQAWPDRGGRWVAALGFSAGMLVRPQVVLLLPALLLAVTAKLRLGGAPRGEVVHAGARWLAVVALAVFVGFLPLVLGGLMGDFLGGLRAAAYGGAYNKKNVVGVFLLLGVELITYRVSAVVASLAVLARAAGPGAGRSSAVTWLVALGGALLYAPLSPAGQPYLYQPLWALWCVGLAVLAGMALESEVPPGGVLYLLILLQVAGVAWPRYCIAIRAADGLPALMKGRDILIEPSGYEHPYKDKLVLPPWADYRGVLDYLRTRTSPRTRVANLLKGVALAGPAARLPALPAESATWVFVVKPDDEARFARALEACPDSVVVLWSPGVVGKHDHPLPKLDEVVHRLYRPDVRFGTLEVWRRRPGS